ncbi:MAG: hypothetical protein HY822_23445, partial [Acidobacteria bacterium]|nr:hypothetical protein [Acidobacteriota bacterium]
FSPGVVRKYWLLHGLMRALALKRIEGFAFAAGDLHRQQVAWSGGGTVWVNRGRTDWSAGGHTLPEYGFYARAGAVEAAIERLAGGVVEWARTPELYYVNARGASVTLGPVSTDGAFRLSVEGGALQLTPLPASPAFSVRLRWNELPWKLARAAGAEALDENGAVLRRFPLKDEAGAVALETRAGEFAYRLR